MTTIGLEKRSSSIVRVVRALLDRPQRTVFLPVLAMALGLALAAYGLFREAPRRLATVPPGYAALVNQKGILMSDWIAQTQSEQGVAFDQATPAARSDVLRRMIDEEVLVQRALVLDLPETTIDVRDIMTAAVNNQVAAQVLARAPTDAELRAFFESRRSNYTQRGSMTVQDLVLHVGGYQNADQTTAQAQADAAEAVYQLRAGASLDYVREHFGLVSSGRMEQGAELDFAAKKQLGDKLYPVAEKLRDGEISDPVVAEDGVHILVMQRHDLPTVADFAAVKSRVYEDFRANETQRTTQQNLKALRSQADIVLAPGQSE